MNRRNFISAATLTGTALGLSLPAFGKHTVHAPRKIGVIGLDTSQAPTFIKYFNVKNNNTLRERVGLRRPSGQGSRSNQ
jgi:hypothetical protein